MKAFFSLSCSCLLLNAVNGRLQASLQVFDSDWARLWSSEDDGSVDEYNFFSNEYPYLAYSDDDTRKKTWNMFYMQDTSQFILPNEVCQSVDKMVFSFPNAQGKFRVFHRDRFLGDFEKDQSVTIEGLLGDSERVSKCEPVHLTAMDIGANGVMPDGSLLSVWASFRQGEAAIHTDKGDHFCYINGGAAQDLSANYGFSDLDNNCDLPPPQYKCFTDDWQPWTDGTAKYMQFIGPLAGSSMLDGKPIHIVLEDGVTVQTPLSNKYVQFELDSSNPDCQALCGMTAGYGGGEYDPWDDAKVNSCEIKSANAYYAHGLGDVVIRGFGAIDMSNAGTTSVFGKGAVPNRRDICYKNEEQWTVDRLHQCEYEVITGAIELGQDPEIKGKMVDIYEVAVSNSAKRGDASILINAQYALVDQSNKMPANNVGKLFDVKTPGTWTDAADGPNLFGDGSSITWSYLMAADDLIKVSASNSRYVHNTLIHGNTGSAILLGNFGSGLINGGVQHATIDGVYAHYFFHNTADDQQGEGAKTGVVGAQTCVYGGTLNFEDIQVSRVMIPNLGSDQLNRVNRAVALGAFGDNVQSFCGEFGGSGEVSYQNIRFKNWDIFQEPLQDSLFWAGNNDDDSRPTVNFHDIDFYDTSSSDLWSQFYTGVRIHNDYGAYTVCGTTDAGKCLYAEKICFQTHIACEEEDWENCKCVENQNWGSYDTQGITGFQNLIYHWANVDGQINFPYDSSSGIRRSLRGQSK